MGFFQNKKTFAVTLINYKATKTIILKETNKNDKKNY